MNNSTFNAKNAQVGLSDEAKTIIDNIHKQQMNEIKSLVKPEIEELYRKSSTYFRNQLAEFVYYRTYSRWLDEEGRRESWIETVDRYMNFMRSKLSNKLTNSEYEEVRNAILNQEVMPSMRLMQFAGKAVERTNVCAYNCSYIAPTQLADFAEIMYILMCGTGVGFSVERKFVEALPQIKKQTGKKLPTFVIPDSKEGWADALTAGLQAWYNGYDIEFDYSQIRPYGARLKTSGGRASGPEPLKSLLDFARSRILQNQGRRLSPIDVHDIVCKIGEIVVAGGVRRSALISLSDLDDTAMREAKVGRFWETAPYRAMANNSAVYEHKPTATEFLEEWLSLAKSGTGERGIFNRENLFKTLPGRRLRTLDESAIWNMGCNPCGEVMLQNKQFCNLTEVIARKDDTVDTLLSKIRIATLLGTYQATLTDFGYLSKEWKKNCETERLLGVSITGHYDCPVVRSAEVLQKLKAASIKFNKEYAKRFGINPATAITNVKPSGTVSQIVDSASGLHPRYAPYYIRRIRIAASDPLFKLMRDQGVPYHPEVGQSPENANTWVLEFPVKSPEGAICRNDITAIEQLEYWKTVKMYYSEHNPSVTIYVADDEWVEVGNWVYKNWDLVGGIAFLPKSNHVYQLAPYEEIDEATYNRLSADFPKIDFSLITVYEKDDATEQKQILACSGNGCEIN